jgi:2-polyprenyl-6-methoxyphenol hydroxylase-like FAD-dependent oxidoreductase
MSPGANWRQHAIVMGAGIAGLLAARALSPHFRKVTVLDRDALPATPAPREGVPQGKHIHVLLPGGLGALERSFPGRTAELIRNGAQPFDYGLSQFYIVGRWMPRIQTGLNTLAQTQPFLEHHIRRWIGEIPNVEIVHDTKVSALLWDSSGRRVRGVAANRAGSNVQLPSDLLIDATGRNTRLPRWLAEGGYPPVPETRVGIDLGYATGCFRVPSGFAPRIQCCTLWGRRRTGPEQGFGCSSKAAWCTGRWAATTVTIHRRI